MIKKAFSKENRKKTLALLLAAFLLFLFVGNAVAAVIVHDAFFVRYERPDYRLQPGMYDYGRFADSLPRETLTVETEDADLAAYYYPVQDPKGLAVVVHGYHAGADDLLPLTEALVKGGYAVFAYDGTGNYSSGGDGGIGMCQSLKDLDAVLDWLSVNAPYAEMPKLLVGHSLGGYAVTSVLALHPEVAACAAIAPVCDGADLMFGRSYEMIGPVAYAAKPVFDVYQRILFGDYTRYDAVTGINSVDIPVLIAQGKEDTDITHDGLSVTAYLDRLTNPNVAVQWFEGAQGTHTGILRSGAAEEYILSVEASLQHMQEEKGSALTEEELAAYYKTVDHRLYSEVNPELVEKILETFEKGMKSQDAMRPDFLLFGKDLFLPGFLIAPGTAHISGPAHMHSLKHAAVAGNISVSAFGAFVIACCLLDLQKSGHNSKKWNESDDDQQYPQTLFHLYIGCKYYQSKQQEHTGHANKNLQ